MKDNQDILGRLPIAYFVVCLTMKDNTAENRSTVMAYLDAAGARSPKDTAGSCRPFPWGARLRQAIICGKDGVESQRSFGRRLPRLAFCQSLGFRCRSDGPSNVVVRGYSVKYAITHLNQHVRQDCCPTLHAVDPTPPRRKILISSDCTAYSQVAGFRRFQPSRGKAGPQRSWASIRVP